MCTAFSPACPLDSWELVLLSHAFLSTVKDEPLEYCQQFTLKELVIPVNFNGFILVEGKASHITTVNRTEKNQANFLFHLQSVRSQQAFLALLSPQLSLSLAVNGCPRICDCSCFQTPSFAQIFCFVVVL